MPTAMKETSETAVALAGFLSSTAPAISLRQRKMQNADRKIIILKIISVPKEFNKPSCAYRTGLKTELYSVSCIPHILPRNARQTSRTMTLAQRRGVLCQAR